MAVAVAVAEAVLVVVAVVMVMIAVVVGGICARRVTARSAALWSPLHRSLRRHLVASWLGALPLCSLPLLHGGGSGR